VSFAASHRLGGLRAGHRCGRLHGHSYLVSPTSGTVLPASLEAFVETEWAGRFLNDAVPFEPTSERLAEYLVRAAGSGSVDGVRVSETESSWAEYRVGAR
jgi:6-pyruvoyltetrahydropterin/6-carboxytetrahydropterin synthase